MYFVAVMAIVFIAILVAALLPVRKISSSNNPVCPPAKNSDRDFRETLRYAKDLVPYRDELEAECR